MRWEYKTLSFKKRSFFSGAIDVEAFNQQLDAYGREGWELVSVCPNTSMGAPSGLVAVLKRQK
ncbi:MAG: DUF4177 domain-containing protein [Cellvibrio sp.]|uniref:DUF4177 domain-containing protein n=1 Tax=Cellvibrio sp. TaxID=1965322 RepID=UPI0031B4E657